MWRNILIAGLVLLLIVSSGCVGEKPTETAIHETGQPITQPPSSPLSKEAAESEVSGASTTQASTTIPPETTQPTTLSVIDENQLTMNDVFDGNPTWSPDGKRIAFASERTGNADIWVMDKDGSNKKQLTTDPGMDERPAWNPDGKKIVFVSNRSGNMDLWVMDSDGSNKVQLTTDDAKDGWPGWSPDGKNIFFSSDRSGDKEIWVMDANGENKKQLTSQENNDYGYPQSWSMDGMKIVFTSYRSGNGDIWVMDSDGSSVVQLTTNPSWDGYPAWSPDGKRIAFASERTGNADIWVMDSDGNNKKRLTTDATYDHYPSWSPDGKQIVYEKDSDIWITTLTEVPFKTEETHSPEITPAPISTEAPMSTSMDVEKLEKLIIEHQELFRKTAEGSKPRYTEDKEGNIVTRWSYHLNGALDFMTHKGEYGKTTTAYSSGRPGITVYGSESADTMRAAYNDIKRGSYDFNENPVDVAFIRLHVWKGEMDTSALLADPDVYSDEFADYLEKIIPKMGYYAAIDIGYTNTANLNDGDRVYASIICWHYVGGASCHYFDEPIA